MTLQDLLNIAMRYATAMADAMILACYEAAHECGVKLHAPTREQAAALAGERPKDAPDYERMMRANSDTPRNHL